MAVIKYSYPEMEKTPVFNYTVSLTFSVIEETIIVPKFSKINDFKLLVNARQGLTKTESDLYVYFTNASDVSQRTFLLYGEKECVFHDYLTFPIDLKNYCYSENANSGKIYYGSCDTISCRGESTLARKFVFQLDIECDYTPPSFVVNTSASYGGTVSGGGTYEITNPNTTHTVTITATPKPGYRFKRWTDGNTSQTRALTLSESGLNAFNTILSYTAEFEKIYSEVGYDNMFSLLDWFYSDSCSVNASRGSFEVDIENGTITTKSSPSASSGDFFTEYGVGSNFYSIPVAAGERYVFEYTPTNSDNQAYVFFINSDHSGYLSGTWFANKYRAEANKAYYIEFTAPSGISAVTFRFGSNDIGTIVTFENIAFYKAERKEVVTSITNRQYRKRGTIGNALGELYTPKREGYEFLGWYDSIEGGTKYTASNTFPSNGLTLYSRWKKLPPPKFSDVQMIYNAKQISLNNKVPLKEYFRIIVDVT